MKCRSCGSAVANPHCDECRDDVDVIATPDKPDVFSAQTDAEYALRQLANAIDGERLGWNRRQERDALIRCKDALERVLDALGR